ncbi:MAG: T9SS type A sorting domain-containing protein [Bacteroidetes bacterium]|nr:T9SS type A sorting domain-containing protein [Bacteroidota bacterium]
MIRHKTLLPITFLVFLSAFSQSVSAQKEAWNWFLADSAGIQWINGKTPISNDWYNLKGEEGSGGISDSLGNLLFYTNGVDIYNAKHEKLNKDFDLGGDWSSTQGKLILKHPESDYYHVFTNKYIGWQQSRLYHTAFIIENDTAKFIVKKEILQTLISEGIAAVNHQNGRDITILNHSLYGDTFYMFLLTESGLNRCISISNLGETNLTSTNRFTNISISPSGNFLSFSATPKNFQHSLFKFNSQKGSLSDELKNIEGIFFSGIFSDNDSFMYIDPNNYSYAQYSLKKWDRTSILNSRKTLYSDPNFLGGCARNAPGGKVLITREKQNFISIINNANKPYPQCDFVNKAVTLIQGTCRFGNYNTNQSYFYTPSINYKYKQNCTTNGFEFMGVDTFRASTYNWKINKGNNEFHYTTKNIKHLFTDTGIWQVKYVASNGTRTDSVIKEIEIFPILKPGFLGKDIGYCGNAFPITIQGPKGMNCYTWKKPKGIETYIDHIKADTAGMYIIETCNPVFCTYFDTIKVYEKAAPDTPIILRKGDSLFVSNAENGVQYQWYKGITFTGKSGVGFKLLDTAWYKVQGVVPVNCYSGFDSINVTTLSSKTLTQSSIFIFPNPTPGGFHIQSAQIPIYSADIYTTEGRKLQEYRISGSKKAFIPFAASPGLYFVKVNGGYWEKIWVL